MPYTKDNVSQFRNVNGQNVPLSEVERQEIADEWNKNEVALALANSPDTLAARDVDSASKKDRLLFEVLFQQENRLRVLESKAPIMRAQYRTALINAWKAL